MCKFIWLLAAAVALGQTQVDLRTQSKTVDFSAANPTKPMATGAVLPVTCGAGQMFFLTAAAAGQNVYGCASANTWTLEGGGGTGGSIAVESSGLLVGAASALNFVAGSGSTYAISTAGQTALIQAGADTGVVESLARNQSGAPVLCGSASGSGAAYSCSMAPTLTVYTAGMALNWLPDVNGAGGPTTMNVDALGSKPLKLADGATDPGPGDVVAGRLYALWYDGSSFRLADGVTPAGVLGEAQPVCGAPVRGRLWFVAGGTGVKDSLSVCARDATAVFAWRPLY
jgi:hypothetical protein